MPARLIVLEVDGIIARKLTPQAIRAQMGDADAVLVLWPRDERLYYLLLADAWPDRMIVGRMRPWPRSKKRKGTTTDGEDTAHDQT